MTLSAVLITLLLYHDLWILSSKHFVNKFIFT
nr:MAG TPA: hypothetical protein [Herelleviridae sp.]